MKKKLATKATELSGYLEKEGSVVPQEMNRSVDEDGSELIDIISQAFYGNRTHTQVRRNEIDRFITGELDPAAAGSNNNGDNLSRDREVTRIPGTENLVLIYNKSEEAIRLQKNTEYAVKPLAVIPEMNLKLYSRCIVCRMNQDGFFESLKPEDCEKFMKYLAR